MTQQEVNNLFTHHAKRGNQPSRYNAIRDKGKELAMLINFECTPSPGKVIAIQRVQEAVMWANQSIATGEASTG